MSSSGEGGSGGQSVVGGGEGGDPDGEGGAGASPETHYEETDDGVETVENTTASTRSRSLLGQHLPHDRRRRLVRGRGAELRSGARIELAVQQRADFPDRLRARFRSGFRRDRRGLPREGHHVQRVRDRVGPGTTTLLQFGPYAGTEKPDGKHVEIALQVRAEEDV